ncbi:MAG: UDP-glucose dehydrogenase family protein [Hyphomicrobiales bacterium]
MRIAMIGAGYVGLVSAACFAEMDHEVVASDVDAVKIDSLKKGVLPIYEPQLASIVRKTLANRRLSFVVNRQEAVHRAEAVFIAVGTPPRNGDGKADLSSVQAAVREIAASLGPGALVVIKSTVPVGTSDDMEALVRELQPRLRAAVVSNPEFLRAGSAVQDFKRPDRVVIGAEDDEAAAKLVQVYAPLGLRPEKIVRTSRRSAELIKYAGNAFLATKIAFINEMADLCERVGANVEDIARGIGADSRIGPDFLKAGPGFGGSCFPKDTLALVKMGQDEASPMRIVEAVVAVNDMRKSTIARRVEQALGERARGKTIAVLGLTFKSDTDDLRQSPSLSLIASLQDKGAVVRAYDPVAMPRAKTMLADIVFCRNAYAAAKGADAVVLMTEWKEFRALDLQRLSKCMKRALLVDMRNLLDPERCVEAGFSYHGVGRDTPRTSIDSRVPSVPVPRSVNRKAQRRPIYVNGNGALAEA